MWNALPAELRGWFFVPAGLARHAHARGIEQTHLLETADGRRGPTLVASYGDLKRTRGPVVYLEHGIGQTYSNMPGHGSYPGGLGHERVELFLCPSQRVADLWAHAYPEASTAVIGIPRLDPWHGRHSARNDPPVVCLSFHWNANGVAPEGMWAFPHYMRSLEALAKSGWKILGHGHPRVFGQLIPWYRRAGILPVRDFEEVLERADLYAVDNSSTLYEFASTGRPVVALNAPWYRRHVEHGVRFWAMADVGLQVDRAEALVATIAAALEDTDATRRRREQISDELIAWRDGSATERAVAAITRWLVDQRQAVAA